MSREMTEKGIIGCPDCELDIEYNTKIHDKGVLETSHGPVFLKPVIEMWVPGACPRCGVCLK